jgi:hypothetical protein
MGQMRYKWCMIPSTVLLPMARCHCRAKGARVFGGLMRCMLLQVGRDGASQTRTQIHVSSASEGLTMES